MDLARGSKQCDRQEQEDSHGPFDMRSFHFIGWCSVASIRMLRVCVSHCGRSLFGSLANGTSISQSARSARRVAVKRRPTNRDKKMCDMIFIVQYMASVDRDLSKEQT